MHYSTILAASLVALASAQETSVVSIFMLAPWSSKAYGSVVTANADTTRYTLGCAAPTGAATPSSCPYIPGNGIEQISSSTWCLSQVFSKEDMTYSYSCEVDSAATRATCINSVIQAGSDSKPTTTVLKDNHVVTDVPLTVTAGLEKLQAAATPTGGTATKTSGGGSGPTGAAVNLRPETAALAVPLVALAGLL